MQCSGFLQNSLYKRTPICYNEYVWRGLQTRISKPEDAMKEQLIAAHVTAKFRAFE